MQLLFFCVFCIFETSSCLSWTQIIPLSTHSHLNECHQKQIYTESHSMPPLTALRHPPAVRSPATLPTAIVASRKTKPVRKKKVNPCQSVLPSSLVTDLSFFFRKSVVLYDKPCIHLQICVQACVCVRAVFHWHMRPHLCRPASQIPQSSKHTNLPHQSISQIVATKIIVLDVSNDNQWIYVLQFFLTHQDSPQMHSKGFTSGKCSAWPWRIAVSIMKPGAFYHKLKQPDWLITETVITFAVSMQARKPFGFHMCDLPFIHSHTNLTPILKKNHWK